MAHNLSFDEKTQTYSFASAGNKPAWHGLGQVLPQELLTAEECIKYANLGYEVKLNDVKMSVGGQDIVIPNQFATYRTDTNVPLGIVGSKYHVVQNSEAFGFFDAIIGEASAIYETAGALGKGEHVFITAKMPEQIRIANTDDLTEVYIVLKMSHDGSGSIKAMVTPVRVVCQNTLNAALRNHKSKVSIRHTANAKTKLAEAHKLLGITHAYVEEVQQLFNHLAKKKVSDAAFKELVEVLFPSSKDEETTRTKNIREGVTQSYFTGVGQENILGTGWGAYNAVTHYLGHSKSYHTQDSKFESLLEGHSAGIQQKAFDFLLQLS